MMKTFNLLFFTALLLLLTYCNNQEVQSPPDQSEYLQENWAMDDLWNDGQAEVAKYKAQRIVYGKPRDFEYVYVLVKETFNKEYQVKTDDYSRDDLYEVMKVNKFCRIPTLAYPYHYLTSVFTKRNEPGTLHKLTNTSQEWCGNTAKSFLEKDRNYLFEYFSYWDGEGNGSAKIEKGPWFEDQLSYTLRTLKFEEGLSFEAALYPMQISSKAILPEAETATISVNIADKSDVNSYSQNISKQVWRVSLDREEGVDLTFWFGAAYPNYLLKMESSDGRKLDLTELTRDAYWAHE